MDDSNAAGGHQTVGAPGEIGGDRVRVGERLAEKPRASSVSMRSLPSTRRAIVSPDEAMSSASNRACLPETSG